MCHIYALSEWQFQHLISVGDRSIDYLHSKLARVVIEAFKFKKLKLNWKRRVFHFKRPNDRAVSDKLMDRTIECMFISFSISCFKLVTAMFFIFQFQHFCSHPLLY